MKLRRMAFAVLAAMQMAVASVATFTASSFVVSSTAEAGTRSLLIAGAVGLAIRNFGRVAGAAAFRQVMGFAGNAALRNEVRSAIMHFAQRNTQHANSAGQLLRRFDDEVLRFQNNIRNRAPYNPRVQEAERRSAYGSGNVSSSTVPPAHASNARFAGAEIKVGTQRVVFDNRGFPIFDDVARFDTRLSRNVYNPVADRKVHMQLATRDLEQAIVRGEVQSARFNRQQLAAIRAGDDKIPGYTWHHHQDLGRMQLVPEAVHDAVRHIGGIAMHR